MRFIIRPTSCFLPCGIYSFLGINDLLDKMYRGQSSRTISFFPKNGPFSRRPT